MSVPGSDRLSHHYTGIESLSIDPDSAYRWQRGRRRSDDQPVLLKSAARTATRETAQLQREFAVARQYTHEGLLTVLDLIEDAGYCTLVLEDPGGEPLPALLNEIPARSVPLARAMRIGRRLAQTLAALHQAGFVYRDLQPANVWVDRYSASVWLNGTANISTARREQATIQTSERLQLNPAYLAPEQTGRINRFTDYRADYYALGVLLYRLLTGQLPFQAQTRLELSYAHIAQAPPAPETLLPELPPMVSRIVLRLLAKAAEERYQSGFGIAADLDHCLAELSVNGSVPLFEQTQHDIPLHFELPQKPFGREQETAELKRNLDALWGGGNGITLVAGPAGVGKSTLILERRREVVQRGGLFIIGKCEQGEPNQPYRVIRQLLRHLLQRLLMLEPAALEDERRRIEGKLAGSLDAITTLVPEFALLGVAAAAGPAPKLEPEQSRNRLHYCIRQLLGGCADKTHPLALFIDDLQWIDSASLELLDYLLHRLPAYLWIFGAYRDDNAGQNPALQMLAQHRARGLKLTTLPLHPLTLSDIEQFTAQALRIRNIAVQPLAQLIYQKTAGNPLYIRIFLQTLHEHGSLHFEPGHGWVWDDTAIAGFAAVDGSVDLLLVALQRLPAPTRQVIARAALFGNDFDVAQPGLIGKGDKGELETHLQLACRSGVLLHSESGYRFFHDRVQQAAYELLPAGECRQLHLFIARALLDEQSGAALDAGSSEPTLFAATNHLNQALMLLTQPAERDWALQVNLQAARAAYAGSAFPAAHEYFQQALKLLDDDAWSADYPLTVTLYGEAAQAAYLSSDFIKGKHLSARLRDHARSAPDAMPGYRIAAEIAFAEERLDESERICLEALALLDIELPADKSWETLQVTTGRLAQRLDNMLEHGLPEPAADIPAEYDDRLLFLTILTYTVAWSNLPLIISAACRGIELILQYGIQRRVIRMLSLFAAVRVVLLEDIAGAGRTDRFALSLLQRLNEPGEEPMIRFNSAIIVSPYSTSLHELYPRFPDISQLALERGDRITACPPLYHYCVLGLHGGRPLAELEQTILSCQDELISLNNRMFLTVLQRLLHLVRLLRGSPDMAGWQLQAAAEYGTPVGLRILRSELMVAHLLLPQASALPLVLATGSAASQHMLPGIPDAFYRCLILLNNCAGATQEQRQRYLDLIGAQQRVIERRARMNPQDYRHKLDLVTAEKLRVLGCPAEALAHFATAIEGARRHGFLQEQALAAELALRCYLDLDQPALAALHLQMALAVYLRWGAEAKCRQLREAYATLLTDMAEQAALPPLIMPESPASVNEVAADNGNGPEPATIQAAAQALAGLLDLEQLLQKLMTLALQSTGAQRGLLISERNQELQIDVSAFTSDDTFHIERQAQTITADMLPLGVLLYVARTLSTLRIDDAVNDEQFAGDAYLHSNGVKSILCLPLYKEPEQMTAFLYLEHAGITGAFTPEHVTAAQILATHAAVALHNARLHHDLQQQFEQRQRAETRLQQALSEVAALKEKLAAENVYLRRELENAHSFHEVVGQSEALKNVLQQVELVAATDTSVLILGETGTGKELIAQALHQRSARKNLSLIKVNCSALPATLIESELFGHEKGAFTGATGRQIGRFELADGGTLFLDEIGDLPLELQAKLLRVLQEGEFERLGSGKTHKVDVRIIAATNRELDQLSRQGLFRADLYYRLNTFPVRLPALRERREDIPLLVWYFITKHQNRLGRHIDKISTATMTALQGYDWPGNIRELENVIERSLILTRGETLRVETALLPRNGGTPADPHAPVERNGLQPHGQDLKEIEREHILHVLQQCDWKIKGDGNAAERLGLAPSTLRWKMKKLGIERPR